MRQQRNQAPYDPLDLHKPRPIDGCDYVCACGWIVSWSGPPLAEQVAAHHAEVLRISKLSEFEQMQYHIQEALKPRGYGYLPPELTIARRLTDWGYTNTGAS